MKRFSKFYLIILIIFIIGGVFARFFITATEEDAEVAEQDAASTIPGYETMLHVQQVAEEQQLQDALINVEIAQQDALNSAVIHIQSNEFMDEQVLLKDSYNMLTKLAKLEELAYVQFIWYKPVNNQNTIALTFTLQHDALLRLASYTYSDIPSMASQYDASF